MAEIYSSIYSRLPEGSWDLVTSFNWAYNPTQNTCNRTSAGHPNKYGYRSSNKYLLSAMIVHVY